MITFLRVRPADTVNDVWAATRRREGATAVEIQDPGPEDLAGAFSGGLLTIAGPAAEGAAAWAVSPADALALSERGVPGWRITVLDEGPREEVLDALARSRAAFLRTGRSRVAAPSSTASRSAVPLSRNWFM